MQLSKEYADKVAPLIANAATIFNPAADSENMLRPFKNNLTPIRTTPLASYEWSDFVGSTPVITAPGAADNGNNPVTGEYEIRPKEPIGGFQWKVTDDDNLPQTIYGVAMLNADMDKIVAFHRLAVPVVLTAVGDIFSFDDCVFNLPLNPLS